MEKLAASAELAHEVSRHLVGRNVVSAPDDTTAPEVRVVPMRRGDVDLVDKAESKRLPDADVVLETQPAEDPGVPKMDAGKDAGPSTVVDEDKLHDARDAAKRILNLANAAEGSARLRKIPGMKDPKVVGNVAGGVVGGMRIVDGYQQLKAGIEEQDFRKKLMGIKELGMGTSMLPSLSRLWWWMGPVGLTTWLVLLLWELRDEAQRPGLREEMKSLGWAGAVLGWLLPRVWSSAAVAGVARALGMGGTALLAFKDVLNVIDGQREHDTKKRVESLGLLALDAGVLLGFVGMPVLGAALVFGGLAPWLGYKLSKRFKKAVDSAFALADRVILDRAFKAFDSVLGPPLRWVGKKLTAIIEPAERWFFSKLIDRPAKKLEKKLKPIHDKLFKKHGRRVEELTLKYVFGPIDRALAWGDRAIGAVAKGFRSIFRREQPAEQPAE